MILHSSEFSSDSIDLIDLAPSSRQDEPPLFITEGGGELFDRSENESCLLSNGKQTCPVGRGSNRGDSAQAMGGAALAEEARRVFLAGFSQMRALHPPGTMHRADGGC